MSTFWNFYVNLGDCCDRDDVRLSNCNEVPDHVNANVAIEIIQTSNNNAFDDF